MAELAEEQRALLATYLDDHWAGAGGGRELARRLASNNTGTDWGPRLAALAADIEEDEAVLGEIRDALGVDGGTLKRTVAMLGEKVSRLKPNHRASSYSPLSRMLELEGLMAGVVAKQRLWDSIVRSRVHQLPRLLAFDFPLLLARATDQLDELERIHHDAACLAFGAPETLADRTRSDQ